MKKRIYELTIEEQDELSGLDAISLVDEPAIEYNFLYFNKQKPLFFDIPDGDDAKYAEYFKGKGEREEDLLADGWVLDTKEPINYEQFALGTAPNADSVDDNENVRVRYRYGLHPSLEGQPYIIDTSRFYCQTLVGYNLVFRREDILSLPPNEPSQDDGGSGGAPYRWRGGYNCRHYWWKMTYKKDGKITNNANANKNKVVDEGGREITTEPEWNQPSTVVSASRGTLTYAKEQKFAIDEEKHIVVGPAMVPDMEILRRDEEGEYYVYFSAETIRMIAEKYLKNKLIDQVDTQHSGDIVQDTYVTQSWIKEFEEDKSVGYGFKDLPIGTWFIEMKVNNPDVWSKIKEGELRGFSVSGFFAQEISQLSKEEEFLYELAQIVKKY